MQIGQLSKRAGVPAKTIRYYEQVGLLPRPARHENGYRDYGKQDEETLRFVVRARGLGFSIRDIADLLTLWHDRNRASAEVKRLAKDHIAELEARIRDLEAMRRTLTDLAERCHGDDRPDCPIIENLAAG
ncbi:MAG: Cu(I)-responsive transcriptional regulator [Rhodospirillales bacterium]